MLFFFSHEPLIKLWRAVDKKMDPFFIEKMVKILTPEKSDHFIAKRRR
jgi:hypothetical protein